MFIRRIDGSYTNVVGLPLCEVFAALRALGWSRLRDTRTGRTRGLGLALVVRLGVVAWLMGDSPPSRMGTYHQTAARRLASGAGYTWLWPDGLTTNAAHYPVGYPAILAVGYAILGASTTVAMLIQAGLGPRGPEPATHSLVDGPGVARWLLLAAGLAVAFIPRRCRTPWPS